MLLLSKIASVLVTPLGAVALLLAAGAALGRRQLAAAGLLLLWVAAMPLSARLALSALEGGFPPQPLAAIPEAGVAIVLGGALGSATPPRSDVDLGDAADRVLLAARLYRAGKVKALLVTGGNLPWSAPAVPEAEAIRALLEEWGVPATAVITEDASRTTAENARAVKAMWPRLGFSSALLVTSAWHMPRALAAFRKEGLPVTPAATDVRAVAAPLTLLDVLPDAAALQSTSLAVRELAGLVVYWLRGDIR